jgi:hypothetical protein
MKKMLLILILVSGFGIWGSGFAAADTIYTKDNKELKGIVVEDYKDRVVLSTVDGEQTIMKSDIKELYYDNEEQNLIKLAEQSREKGDLIKAFIYYDKAFKLNPDSKQAKDGIVFLQGYLFKKDMSQKEEVVRRHNEFEEVGIKPETAVQSESEKLKADINKLRETSGIALASKDGVTEIESVSIGSSAQDAGIRNGDILVAVWGRLVGYMTLSEVIETVLEKTSLETKCTINRRIDVNISDNRNLLSNTNDLIGMTIDIQPEGLVVSAVKEGSPAAGAGIKKGDLLVDINGNLTRYMTLKRAIELIKKSKGDTVSLTLQREVVIWGKQGGA